MKNPEKYDFSKKENRNAFYLSGEWRSLREYVLMKQPLCVHCLSKGLVKAANVVDHKADIAVRPEWRLNFDNCQSLCKECHDKKTWRDAVNSELDMEILNRRWKIEPLKIPSKK